MLKILRSSPCAAVLMVWLFIWQSGPDRHNPLAVCDELIHLDEVIPAVAVWATLAAYYEPQALCLLSGVCSALFYAGLWGGGGGGGWEREKEILMFEYASKASLVSWKSTDFLLLTQVCLNVSEC